MYPRELFLAHFDYDADKGELHWKIPTSYNMKPGSVAGCVTEYGYMRVKFFGKDYMVHNVIWFIEKGEWPKDEIDHRDRNKLNNRIDNLREATHGMNGANTGPQKNNLLGVKHMSLTPSGRYAVCIRRSGVNVYYSSHETFEEGKLAAELAAEKWDH
jgi:hypothetical protein